MRLLIRCTLAVCLLAIALVGSSSILSKESAALLAAPCPDGKKPLFVPQNVNIPAVPSWGFPAYSGDKALEPLPDSFDIVERAAWFDGIPVTIRPFPRPGVGDGGPEDNHADMYVFFFADGRPVPQMPLLEAVPLNAAPGISVPGDIQARMFSANWEVHVVRVPQDYVPGSIQSILDLTNPRWVLEDLQTNIFVTFPIIPQRFTIPGLNLNKLSVETGVFQGKLVFFVEYDIWDNEYTKKPMYLFRKPSGEFVGDPVVSVIPGMPHYSSLFDVFIVEVPANFDTTTLHSEAEILASGHPLTYGFEVFSPVEAVEGNRSVFPDLMDILTEPDGKFHKVRFPKNERFPTQTWFSDGRFNQVTLGFTDKFNQFSFNEVEIPRMGLLPLPGAVDGVLEAALHGQNPDLCAKVLLPPHIARQRFVEDADGRTVHLSQANLDARPLSELVVRGQALFEREFTSVDGLGPANNAPSCATCHGLPFNLGVDPAAGGPGVRFRNALQPTESGKSTSRNTPHVFGSGVLTQLGIERHAGGQPVTDASASPHNWKGTVPTVRAFTAGALRGEIGLEAVEKVAELAGVPLSQAAATDFDKDGVIAEMTVGDVTAMTVFQASLPRPYQIDASNPEVVLGRQVFERTGCTQCHQPIQTLQSTVLEVTNPETAGVVKVPLGSATVELFSDLKRHKMGSLLAEPGAQGGIPADVFKTKELWGVGDSAPYLHNGSVDTLEEAIARHRGLPLDELRVQSQSTQRIDANTFKLTVTLQNRYTTPIELSGLSLVLTRTPEGVTVTPVDRDGGPEGRGALWTVANHLAPGSAGPIAPNGSIQVEVRYRTDTGQEADTRLIATTQTGYSEALHVIETFNELASGERNALVRFLKSLVLPRPADLEQAAFNSLTSADRAILGSLLGSLQRNLEPLFFAWIVSPALEGTGKLSGTITIQVSITSEVEVDQASVIVDGTTVLPLTYNFSSGFHEATLDTSALKEGDHVLSLDIRSSQLRQGRPERFITSMVTVDNISDSSPQNRPSTGIKCVTIQ